MMDANNNAIICYAALHFFKAVMRKEGKYLNLHSQLQQKVEMLISRQHRVYCLVA